MEIDQQAAAAEQEPIAETQVEGDATPEPTGEPASEPRRTAREALEKAFSDPEPKKAEDAPQEPENGPARGPDGKFVSKEDSPEAKEAPKQPDANKEAANFNEAPARFSADAKQAWAQAPESVRAEIHRMQRELESGLQQKDEQIEPLKPYFDIAEKQGVKLSDALGRYITMEQALAKDPRKGMEALAQNFGMTLDQFISKVQTQQPQGGEQADPRDQQITQLTETVQQLQQQLGQVSQTVGTHQEQAINRTIEEFASQAGHERFDELSGEIAKMLQTGYASDLQDAYEKADRMNPVAPTPDPVPTQNPEPAKPVAQAQTRQPRSLTGAPNPGSDPTMNRTPSKSPRDALKRHLFGV
ncbi:hypothetical protein [uncultured Roseobacter sp.]|uniref:hypothetical protein n=1 Tax=uncultured Roseobacter sp. TaxID=114847 RepID=UPI0026378136|nr:hypothetical protein [uncultured Roseobacter sp.]